MAFFPPIPLIRKNVIIKRLMACGAESEDTAKTLAEAGVINPDGFSKLRADLLRWEVFIGLSMAGIMCETFLYTETSLFLSFPASRQ